MVRGLGGRGRVPNRMRIRARFETWRELLEFLAEENALVEVWACAEAGTAKAAPDYGGGVGPDSSARRASLPP